MQTKSTIQKTLTRTDIQYNTTQGFLIVNGLTGEMTYGSNQSDSYCGVTDLQAGLKMIQWDDMAQIKTESISWLK